jgi:TPR repeat protein
VERGDEQLSEGAVAAARLLYTRAADAGLAQAALALGATYDPAELARLKVIGINPDVAAARAWYQKAQALGAPEAISRLKRLEGR